jgi:hypothetical protein
MEYLCQVWLPKELDSIAQPEKERIDRESMAYDVELERSGHMIMAQALQPATAAVTVRVRDGRMSTTDGPFAETKEQLGGFILISARDLNEAIQIAAKIPLAKYGSIEVRPIMKISPLGNPIGTFGRGKQVEGSGR